MAGNLVDLHEKDNNYSQTWNFAYDDCNRLIYVDDWDEKDNYKGLPHRVYAFLYDSAFCTALLTDMPNGIPKGDMRRLYYQPQPDGSILLRITVCGDITGNDSLDYVHIHEKPNNYLPEFFDARLAVCAEYDTYSGLYAEYMAHQLFFSPGEYTFDSQGRLVAYYLTGCKWLGQTSAMLQYDEKGRLAEMRATEGVLARWHHLLPAGNQYTFVHYDYDEWGNVKSKSCTDKDEVNITYTYSYTYDSYGNWLSRSLYLNDEIVGTDKREIFYW